MVGPIKQSYWTKNVRHKISVKTCVMNPFNGIGLLSVLMISLALSDGIDGNHDIEDMENQLQSMSTNIDHLTEKVIQDETLTFPIQTAEIQANQNDGTFKKPTDRKDLLNKLNELKNNITKMIDDMTTHAGDITSMKDRINMLEKELENLTKQLSNAGHDVQQELKDFSNELSKLTASLNDYYRKQEQKEKQRLEEEMNKDRKEFINAIKLKLYDYAALKLSLINDDDIIENFTLSAYQSINDIDSMLTFSNSVIDTHKRLLIYKVFNTNKFLGYLQGICNLFKVKMKILKDLNDFFDIKTMKDAENLSADFDDKLYAASIFELIINKQGPVLRIYDYTMYSGKYRYEYYLKHSADIINLAKINHRYTAEMYCYLNQCMLRNITQ
ncbi:hypothetical protein O3M35_003055 [Rhynocoris fuscipes]|uniref:Uncharacterized protein n=1 Tax=Rhynocoris fuscipes TaxID=488301 RepID=A0AAW1CLP6_9HEMI